MDKQNMKLKTNYRQALEEKHINAKRQTYQQSSSSGSNNYYYYSIRVYLRANLTAQGPITKLA
jgi:hypothetical protein